VDFEPSSVAHPSLFLAINFPTSLCN